MSRSVCLVAMPWQSLELPSLPLGLLRAVAVEAGHPVPLTYHGSLRWAEFLIDATDGEFGVAEYSDVAENGLLDGLGDWVFTGVLHSDPEFGMATLQEYSARHGIDIAVITRMREYAADFATMAAAEILDLNPSIIGFTSTFMQNVPSLALAKEIKRLAPDVAIIMGGGNCDGPMGAALHRNYKFLDFVARGEGERVFPMLLSALAEGSDLAAIPGLCWRDTDGAHRCNPQVRFVNPTAVPVPDFDDWFERLEESPIEQRVEPKLVLETSRGCWWGEKHQCTFCGLNGSLMDFRAKSADAVLSEIDSLVRRYKVLDIITTDNIADNTYFRDVFPRISELGWDLRLHYEVKANLRSTDVIALRDAGVVHVQPGIESLISRVLKIMDKGTSAIQNIRTLRDCESAGLTVSWSWLYGFPGELPEDYEPALRQVPALVHLQPPSGAARIMLERFSPYFEDTEGAFAERTTGSAYRHVYALPEEELRDMVYFFDTTQAGLNEESAIPLHQAVSSWSENYLQSSLVYSDTGDSIRIDDHRIGWSASHYDIADPMLRSAYLMLEQGKTIAAVTRTLSGQGFEPQESGLRTWLAELAKRGLVFEENGRWITLPTASCPIKMP
jgi:ribosomal peptide maturation radical SAM protein 1